MGSRSTSRRLAMQAIFQSDMSGSDVKEAISTLLEDEKIMDDTKDFSLKLAEGVINNKEKIDDKIREISKNWSFDRINQLEKSILRLAIYEMFFDKGTPKAVVINEAVELAKRYGDENSTRFINGILGAVVL